MPRSRTTKKSGLHRALNTVRSYTKDHFIPHEGNNHIPHVLHHRALFGYGVFLILLKLLVLVVTVALPARSLLSSAITAVNIVDLTNAARRSLGVAELRMNPQLSQAATAKAEDMVINQYFAHNSPTGVTPWSWVKSAGYVYRYAGENLAVHFTTAEGVTDGWLASPTHRENIASEKFTEIGIGIARGDYQGVDSTFVVQMFGRPQDGAVIAPAPTETPAPTPAPAPSAAPLPERVGVPVASEPEPTPAVSQSTIAPSQNGYTVTITVPEAKPLAAAVGNLTVPLTPGTQPSTYTAQIPKDAALGAPAGEPVRVLSVDQNGSNTLQTIGWLAPEAQAQDMYAYPPQRKTLKILGFINVDQLDDQARKFYIYIVLFLSAALLISLLAKVRMHHPKVVGHTLFLVGLALVLFII